MLDVCSIAAAWRATNPDPVHSGWCGKTRLPVDQESKHTGKGQLARGTWRVSCRLLSDRPGLTLKSLSRRSIKEDSDRWTGWQPVAWRATKPWLRTDAQSQPLPLTEAR